MIFLRQSTASQEVILGPFLDDTDGKTAETALTIANTDIKVWKTGGTTESNKNSGGATHIASGRYYAVFDATDTNTIGPLEINVHVSGALPVKVRCCVLDEAVYDVMFGTTALSTYAGADTSGTTTLLSRIGSALTITSGRVNADVTHIATAAVSTSTAQLGVNVVNAAGTAWGSGAITAASIATGAITSAKFAAGAIDNAAMSIDGSELTAIPWNAAWDAEVQSEVQDAIEVNHLDHLLAVTYDPATKPGAADALFNELVESDAGVARFTANALEQAPTGGSAPTAAQIADAVWDEAQADHVSAGSFGVIASEIADILTDTADIQPKIGTPTDFGSGTSTIAANLQDLADNGTATYDRATDSLQAIRDRGDAAWTTATGFSTHSAADVWSVGTRLLTAGTNIVLAKGTGITGFNDLSAAQVNAEVDTALADYDGPTNAEMVARTPSATAIANVETVFNTDFATNYTTVNNGWVTFPGGYYDQGQASNQPWPDNLASLGINGSGHVSRVTVTDAVTGAVGSVTGNVGGNVTGSVGSVLGGINTTGGTITTLDALDTAQDSQHSTTQGLVTTVDTVVDGIKTKTDSLTFTVAGQVDSNIQYVNDTKVGGTGATGDEWGPV